VQVDPIKPKLNFLGTKRLKLKLYILLSTSAFKFKLRRYTSAFSSGETTMEGLYSAATAGAVARSVPDVAPSSPGPSPNGGSVEAGEAGDRSDDVEGQQNALLFMRRAPGSFVFCGRLEAVGGGQGAGLRLVDSAALRQSSTYHQLIGCRLLPAESVSGAVFW